MHFHLIVTVSVLNVTSRDGILFLSAVKIIDYIKLEGLKARFHGVKETTYLFPDTCKPLSVK